MNRVLPNLLLALVVLPAWGNGPSAPVLDPEVKSRLLAGESVVLPKRPDEGAEADARFVTVAALIAGTRETVWEVIHDKENAADFLTGVLESKVLEREDQHLLVEQRTVVGGPKGSYLYRLRHELTPQERSWFTYAGGELRDVIGGWWIFDDLAEGKVLVVYALHIDAGLFAPQSIVKAGMRKSMPKTLAAVAAEVARREAAR